MTAVIRAKLRHMDDRVDPWGQRKFQFICHHTDSAENEEGSTILFSKLARNSLVHSFMRSHTRYPASKVHYVLFWFAWFSIFCLLLFKFSLMVLRTCCLCVREASISVMVVWPLKYARMEGGASIQDFKGGHLNGILERWIIPWFS